MGFRSVLLTIGGIAGGWYFPREVHQHYPIGDWFFWDIMYQWAICGLLSLTAVCAGLRLLELLGGAEEEPLEVLTLALASGTVSVVVGWCLLLGLGLLQLSYTLMVCFAMLAVGARTLVRWFRQSRAGPASSGIATSGQIVLLCAGVVATAWVYLGAMTPDAINYDAGWYHLPVSEAYVREGSLVRFPSDYNMAFPQLAALLYTWGWLAPHPAPAFSWGAAMHIEFSYYLWTLVGIAALVRRTLGERVPRAFSVFYLFPAIFVYDSNLGAQPTTY